MPYKDPVKRKEKKKEYYEKNREIIKEEKKQYYEKNKENKKEYASKSREYRKRCAIESIISGSIIEQYAWDMWCNSIKCFARKNPYSYEFTNDIMFEMLSKGCFYCGDIATSIDRIDSSLDHTPDNCVASCWGCNNSKGTADSSTFIRKAYYRAREEYYDGDTSIWFINKQKPRMYMYKHKAEKKGVPFDLTKEDFDILIIGNCKYCKRSPTTWFGVDRVIPSLGYVIDNVVSCCFDCNLDKLEDDVDTVVSRNERIAARVDAGDLVIKECEKVILHTGKVI
jgi:5-methylcytosine-specific restriction endonuclease McrA